jgi:hypothetical protein
MNFTSIFKEKPARRFVVPASFLKEAARGEGA